jgi:hypothetical protein
LSATEAKALLRERFGGHNRISYMPDMDKLEEGIQIYGFSVDYSASLEPFGSPYPYSYAYAWVNSVTGITNFEEAGYTEAAGPNWYANIPDNMFPIPMLDGVIIPYNSFSPPYHEWDISIYYVYIDTSVMKSYQAQLRDAGFVDHGSVQSVDSLWRYDRGDDGATLIVEMFNGGEMFSMNMYVNYLNS